MNIEELKRRALSVVVKVQGVMDLFSPDTPIESRQKLYKLVRVAGGKRLLDEYFAALDGGQIKDDIIEEPIPADEAKDDIVEEPIPADEAKDDIVEEPNTTDEAKDDIVEEPNTTDEAKDDIVEEPNTTDEVVEEVKLKKRKKK